MYSKTFFLSLALGSASVPLELGWHRVGSSLVPALSPSSSEHDCQLPPHWGVGVGRLLALVNGS